MADKRRNKDKRPVGSQQTLGLNGTAYGPEPQQYGVGSESSPLYLFLDLLHQQ
jgi:hypothetical protein